MISTVSRAHWWTSYATTWRPEWLPMFCVTAVVLGGALFARASLIEPVADNLDEPLAIASCSYTYDSHKDRLGYGPRTGARAEDAGGPSDPASFPR